MMKMPPINTETLRRRLLDWYALHRRRLPWRETSDPYAIWVSEVMLQQTQVATAIPYYHRFMQRFPTTHQLAQADLQEVLKLWEGLGYYSRARNLHRAAGEVVSRFGGRMPDDPAAFRSLPGVGDYIAAAVLSIAFGRVLPVVDGNVKRVLARLLEMDTPVNHSGAHKVFKVPAGALISPEQPADFNQAIMELGALVCRPKQPLCPSCPLADLCLAYRHGTTAQFPKREPRRTVPHRHVTIAVILKKGKMLVVQRQLEGFLGGLWEFPAVPADGADIQMTRFTTMIRESTGLKTTVEQRLTRIKHAYSHFKLSGDVYLCRHVAGRVRLNGARSHRWVTFGALARLPMHKANHKFMKALEAALTDSTAV
jgi:A/G-specific adenine glycosylase